MLSNEEIYSVALRQSAVDCGCRPEDFSASENVIVTSVKNENARKYLSLPFKCNLVTYGGNIVASVREDLAAEVGEYISAYPPEHCFETPNMRVLDEKMLKHGLGICFMAEYFLPDVNKLKPLESEFEIKILNPKDFRELYTPQWSNALCEKRRELDVLGAGAYCGGRLIALAGCSADCEDMRQIGVDTLPEFRRRGAASAVTSRLALEILERGKVPFYCAAWSNIKSVRNALKCGFYPAWAEMTVKETDLINELNGVDNYGNKSDNSGI